MIVSGRVEKPSEQRSSLQAKGAVKLEGFKLAGTLRQMFRASGKIKVGPLKLASSLRQVLCAAGKVSLAPIAVSASLKTLVKPAGGLEVWSNSAYAAAGLALLLQAQAYGLILLVLAWASWKYHATRKKRWQHADRAMVLASVFALVALAYLSPPWMLAAVAVAVAIERFMPNLEVPVIASAIVIVAKLKAQAWGPLALIALAAGLVWMAERWKDSTTRAGALTYDILHSIWHLLSAGALYLTAHLLL